MQNNQDHEYIEDYSQKVQTKYNELTNYSTKTLEELTKIDDDLRNEYQGIRDSFSDKTYSIKSSKEQLKNLVKFFQQDVMWKGRQAFAIDAIYGVLVTQLETYNKNDNKTKSKTVNHFKLKVHEMEGIMHFLAGHESYGVVDAREFKNKIGEGAMSAISNKLDDAKKLIDRMQEIEVEIKAMSPFLIAALEGIDLNAEISSIKNEVTDITDVDNGETPIVPLNEKVEETKY